MKALTLKEALCKWSDTDYAQMALAISLGLMAPDTNYEVDAKHIFWSNNPMGNMLYDSLLRLAELGVLEHQIIDTEDQFRWNLSFKGSWET